MTNIIDIYFDSVGSTATAPSKLWQWSKGQIVRINGLDLPTVYQVHFSNNPTLGTAEPVAVSGNMVSIPDIYLTTGEPVYLFIWLSDETSAETIRKGTIYVAKRSQPSGEYDPTAEQQTIIDSLIGSINTAVDTAEGYAESAQTYSGNAATSATEALNASQTAQGYAEQASQTAQGVEVLVNRAEDAADDAETAKQDVEQLKQVVEGLTDDAESAKTDAETARGEAQGFAQTANTKASEALQSASQASQSATTATAQAQTATAKATEASQSAETATTKASEASASATTASTKASEASASASTATTAKNDAVTAKNAAVTARTGAETARTGAEAAAQSVSASAAQIATNTSDITDLKADLDESVNALAIETQNTVTDVIALTWTENYYVDPADGQVKSNSNREYSNKVSVNPGDVITLYRESDGAAFATIGFIAAYYNDVLIPEKGASSVSNRWTVPDGVDAIIMTIAKAYGNATGDRTYTDTTLIPKLAPDVDTLYNIVAPSKPGRIAYSFGVSANGTFTGTDDFQDECGYRICFDAKITSITGEVKIGKGIEQTYGGGIGFDGTNLYQYFSTSTSPTRTQAHGLTLKDYVSITLDVDYSSRAVVTISTNGGMYTWTIPVWRSYYGVLTVESANVLTGCVLSYTSACAKKDIWVFGDSYISYRDATRWMYYLVQTGHTDYLINGYPGRNSSQALAALKVALKMNHIPKTLIWLLGMNDKDGADTPNANWKTSVEEVMEICEQNHIELILATIPNVPSTNTKNTLKNAYVVESGYRYIDFANAISADGSSTWYDGMLSSDNVHPDVQGAIALYSCAVTEVPELIL